MKVHRPIKRLLKATTLLLLLAMIAVACNNGGGGGGGTSGGGDQGGDGGDGGGGDIIPPPITPVIFSSSQQAAQLTSSALAAKAASETQFAVAMLLGLNAAPTSGPSGAYAPSRARAAAALPANIDPALRAALTAMMDEAKSPLIRKAVGKIGSSRAKRVTSINESVTDWCSNVDGKITITGQNNYDEINSTSLISSYTIKFENCRDDLFFTQIDGQLDIAVTESIAANAIESTVTAVNLSERQFAAEDFAVMTRRSVLNGSFDDNNQETSGARSADGSFVVTTPAQGGTPEKTLTYRYRGHKVDWTFTHNEIANPADLSDTEVDDITGLFDIVTTTGGQKTGEYTLAVDLIEKTDFLNDVAGTKRVVVNGTVDQIWTPDISGCQAGRITITTDAAAPRVFTSAGGACPVSGTLLINNLAQITFGSPIEVVVVNQTPATFADCAAWNAAGAACAF